MAYLDYSNGRPGGAAIKAAGYTGVVRYAGAGSTAKRVTAAEYADLRAAGLDVLFVVEQTTQDAVGGYAAGQAKAQALLDDLNSLGINDGVSPLFCAVDAHIPAGGTAAEIRAYAQGFTSVVGKARAGIYGFSEALTAVHGDGTVSYYWQCGSSPAATGTSAFVNLWQQNTGSVTVGGVACDVNQILIPLDVSEDDLTPEQAQQLAAVFNQIVNPYPSQVPGSTVELTLVDFVRAIDARTYANLDAKVSAATAAGFSADAVAKATVALFAQKIGA